MCYVYNSAWMYDISENKMTELFATESEYMVIHIHISDTCMYIYIYIYIYIQSPPWINKRPPPYLLFPPNDLFHYSFTIKRPNIY